MAAFAYVLCAATSFVCSLLLWRAYHRRRIGLLFWSGWCFAGLTLENILLYVDRVLVPDVDLSSYRLLVGLAALLVLLGALIWSSN